MTLRMDEMAWDVYAGHVGRGAPVFLAVGATEQHGYHLPLGVDAMIAEEVCRRAALETGGIIAPALRYGFRTQVRTGGGSHRMGTIGISAATLSNLVREVIVELARDGVRRIVIVDGHFENRFILDDACHAAVDACAALGMAGLRIIKVAAGDPISPKVLQTVYMGRTNPGPELEHAAFLETSLMLAVRPDLVHAQRIREETLPPIVPFDCFPEDAAQVPDSGCLSSPNGATVEIGAMLLEDATRLCVAAVRRAFFETPEREFEWES